MATLTTPAPRTAGTAAHALGGPTFDWIMVGLSGWLIGGLYLDGWAHNHIGDLESFFTPWHGVLYSGFLILAAVLSGSFVRNLRQGLPLSAALPQGYGLSLIGAGIFMAGAVGDMLWHTAFGIEIGVEALLSPTHIILAIGGSLIVTGPLRAGLQRHNASTSFVAHLPMMLSTIIFYSILTFFTVYANPFGTTWIGAGDRPDRGYEYITQAIGITSFLFQSALLAAISLVLLRNNKLYPGFFTLLFAINTGSTIIIDDIFLGTNIIWLFLGALGAGAAADVMLWLLKPSIANILSLRIFIALLPAALFLSYILAIMLSVGLWWSIHLWTGAVVLSGMTGWLVTYLVVPSSVEKVTVLPS